MLRLEELQARFMAGQASDKDIEEWRHLLKLPENREQALIIFREVYGMEPFADLEQENADGLLQHILAIKGSDHKTDDELLPSVSSRSSRIPGIKWLRYAAIIILMIGSGAYLWSRYNRQESIAVQQAHKDVPPGKEGAILTLADGSQVVLDSVGNGLVATQNGTRVMLQNGHLMYDLGVNPSGEIVFNTMTTPRGRQFNITLPDGTKVWLNAASSLRYPTVFAEKKRHVEITGEAYFEVAKDNARPFYVSINNQAEVEVLGTAFNINAYGDEATINTTLLQGAIRVMAAAKSQSNNEQEAVILKPGQQARMDSNSDESSMQHEKIAVENAETEKVTAWRNGLFNFQDMTLKAAMMQISRWYDVEVVYDKAIYNKGLQNVLLAGEIRRDLSLASVVELLNFLGLQFQIKDGNKLYVSP